MFLVDSHCHLDCLDYEKDHSSLDDVIRKAAERDVRFMLAVATTLDGFSRLKSFVGDRPDVAFSCGVHPLNMDPLCDPQRLAALAADPQVIALGETGLDYFYEKDAEQQRQQQIAFRHHIRIGRQLNKPVIVHTRDAREDTLALLKEEKVEECGGVLHCFTEDKETAARLLDMGFYISFSGIITFRNAEQIREAARYVPLDRILVETDSPYLAPVPHRGKQNQPAFTRDVADFVAELKGVDTETLARQTTENFSRLFHTPVGNSHD